MCRYEGMEEEEVNHLKNLEIQEIRSGMGNSSRGGDQGFGRYTFKRRDTSLFWHSSSYQDDEKCTFLLALEISWACRPNQCWKAVADQDWVAQAGRKDEQEVRQAQQRGLLPGATLVQCLQPVKVLQGAPYASCASFSLQRNIPPSLKPVIILPPAACPIHLPWRTTEIGSLKDVSSRQFPCFKNIIYNNAIPLLHVHHYQTTAQQQGCSHGNQSLSSNCCWRRCRASMILQRSASRRRSLYCFSFFAHHWSKPSTRPKLSTSMSVSRVRLPNTAGPSK